ncbi:hypothetical protein [Streptomyces sp. 11x1]|uniref:hypothetical protein n=1 Tax=Streptomyces sp. 11x1 TaxID=3038642 RepID=UPI00292EEDED|nr:hypothetical protein [Streptomyces sp. 11x1]WNZ07264.1 hypothetical protein P8T65_06460 [Streptomyces sp. 11x1]
MHELLAVAGLAAAVVCLAGHLPGPVRGWGPHAAVTVVMAVMVLPGERSGGAALAGTAAVAAAAVWRLCAGCPGLGRAAETADLAAMALLTAAAMPWGTAVPHHGAGAGTGAGELALLVAGCWAATRTGTVMFSQLRGGHGPSARRQDAAAVLMIAAMTAMAW